jgi:RHS repeat-associated protein
MVENYYAFGQPLPKWNSKTTDAPFYDPTKYRYGFNGKEDDDEWSKQDYGFRIYDGRIGRFLSVDPLTGSYPELTSYQFASNNPISGIDFDGLEYVEASKAILDIIGGKVYLDLPSAAKIHKSIVKAETVTGGGQNGYTGQSIPIMEIKKGTIGVPAPPKGDEIEAPQFDKSVMDPPSAAPFHENLGPNERPLNPAGTAGVSRVSLVMAVYGEFKKVESMLNQAAFNNDFNKQSELAQKALRNVQDAINQGVIAKNTSLEDVSRIANILYQGSSSGVLPGSAFSNLAMEVARSAGLAERVLQKRNPSGGVYMEVSERDKTLYPQLYDEMINNGPIQDNPIKQTYRWIPESERVETKDKP